MRQQSSWLANNKFNREGMFRMLARKRRMEKYTAVHGHDEDRDRAEIAEWLEKNEVTICPAFGHCAQAGDE